MRQQTRQDLALEDDLEAYQEPLEQVQRSDMG
jgi:hypothetical protein